MRLAAHRLRCRWIGLCRYHVLWPALLRHGAMSVCQVTLPCGSCHLLHLIGPVQRPVDKSSLERDHTGALLHCGQHLLRLCRQDSADCVEAVNERPQTISTNVRLSRSQPCCGGLARLREGLELCSTNIV